MTTRLLVAASIALALVVMLGAAGRPAGTVAMVERLRALAANGDPLRNPILNVERAALLQQRFNQTESLDVGFALTNELLKAGDTPAALELALKLREAIDSTNIPDKQALLTKTLELLALAYLRAGEQNNCLLHHNRASCVFPITGRGVYQLKDPALSAARIYEQLLEISDRPSYIWLLNLAYMSAGEYPASVPARWRIPPEHFASEYPMGRFVDAATAVGVDRLGRAGGAIMDDFDGDGHLDIVTSSWGLQDQIHYFHNDGNGLFTDRTKDAGLLGITGGLNIVQADFDNDGHLDILVARGAWLFDQGHHPLSLLRNRGDGTFEDVTEKAGLLRFHPTQAVAWADFDGDGWLDLFVGNESSPEDPHPCELFRNRHDGTFVNVAADVGVANVGFVKGAVWGDYNRDGRPDLYVSRFGQPNVLYRNDGPTPGGGWRFTDVTQSAGVAEPIYSFSTWFWDFDNDGWPDLFVAAYTGFTTDSLDMLASEYVGRKADGPRSRLYRNNHDGTFTDVARAVGLDMPLAVMGANFGDFDNDGFLDMYLGTGEPSLSTLIPNRMFRNDGGHLFQDVTTAAGVGHLQKGHGVAIGDIDDDGDQDIYVVLGGAFTGDIYKNALFINPGNGNHWMTLRLRGTHENRSAIGVQIEIAAATPYGDRRIFRTVGSGGSFGGSSLQEEIGLGDATTIRQLSVLWPSSGHVDRFENVSVDRIFSIVEGRGIVPVKQRKIPMKTAAAANR
jgi:hypothetical protein